MERRAFLASTIAAGVLTTLPLVALEDTQGHFLLTTLGLGIQIDLIPEILTDGAFRSASWDDLENGSIFRLRLPDGTLDAEGTPQEVCVAQGRAHKTHLPNGNPTLMVQCRPYHEVRT